MSANTLMLDRPRLYLAGPDVFRSDSATHGADLVRLCAEHGMAGIYPADNELVAEIDDMVRAGRSRGEIARMIFRANVDRLRSCHAVLANLDPFRSPGADNGTSWEMGMAYGLGLPVFAYTADLRTTREKIEEWHEAPFDHRDGALWDRAAMMVEDLGEVDNLMLTRSVVGERVHPDFRSALCAAAKHFEALQPMDGLASA